MSDAVNKPAHYNQGQIECIEAMKIVLTLEEYRGYLKGNVFKYLWREKDKNGNEDIRKGKSYYDRLIELIDESEQQKASDLPSLKDYPFGKLKTAPLNSDTIPEGHRKLGDSLIEPRQVGDLRWSIIEEGYIPISGDEIGCANRDNWAACRKITTEVAGEVTVEVTGEVKPLDGWRFLEEGEVIRKGDRCFTNNSGSIDCLTSVGEKFNREAHYPTIRRNKFEVGEKVVTTSNGNTAIILRLVNRDLYEVRPDFSVCLHIHAGDLAPYIEDAK